MKPVEMGHLRQAFRMKPHFFVADQDLWVRRFVNRSSPLASVNKRQDIMSNDFTRVPLMNAMTTRANLKRKSRKGPALLLVVFASAVTYIYLVD